MDFALSPAAQDFLDRVRALIADEVEPAEPEYRPALNGSPAWRAWRQPPAMEALKAKARAARLWNLFLPATAAHGAELGAGLSNLEYAPLAEAMGRSFLAPEAFNCAAPDTGNMEILLSHGSPAQRERWLRPLLAGEIRSAVCMTEPAVASSDATNMAATARVDGDAVVLRGRKWWSTGLGHPHCRLLVFMGVTDPAAERHRRHSMVLVPVDAPGVRIERMLTVFGSCDEPSGHGEVTFDEVRVPLDHVLGGPGRGFEIAQSRLGPGRIHHCMRALGAAERALELMCRRGGARVAFGKPLAALGGNAERIAEARAAIEQARLLVLKAAWMIDAAGAKSAMSEIAQIKFVVPRVLQRIVDNAIQIHGGAGLSEDFPLAALHAYARTLRIVDGPDEVHRMTVAKLEMKRHAPPRPAVLLDEPAAVREGEELDGPRLDAFLRARIPGLPDGVPAVRQFAGGASNLTYLVSYPGREMIVRRPPVGTKAKSAHAMLREARILAALRPHYPAVPAVLALGDDPAVMGDEFYVMDRLRGIIPRRDLPPELARTPAEAGERCRAMLDQLIALHRVDWRAAGLDELYRGEGYARRQIEGCSDRWRRARTPDAPEGEDVMGWLPARMPDKDSGAAVIHNDFRFDNLVFDPAPPHPITGVLDWEMATIGDPLMDLGCSLAYWVQADDDPAFVKLRRQPTHAPGMWTRREVVEYYAAQTGRAAGDFAFYEVYGLFRLAVIVQQIYLRFFQGQTRNPQFAGLGAMAAYLVGRCRERTRSE